MFGNLCVPDAGHAGKNVLLTTLCAGRERLSISKQIAGRFVDWSRKHVLYALNQSVLFTSCSL
jgi:hypothetical protein